MYLDKGRRSWPSIVIDILEIALTPSTKMRIMYGANLNFNRFSKYFLDLLKRGFLEEIKSSKGKKLYRTTESGKDLLNALQIALDIISSKETEVWAQTQTPH